MGFHSMAPSNVSNITPVVLKVFVLKVPHQYFFHPRHIYELNSFFFTLHNTTISVYISPGRVCGVNVNGTLMGVVYVTGTTNLMMRKDKLWLKEPTKNNLEM